MAQYVRAVGIHMKYALAFVLAVAYHAVGGAQIQWLSWGEAAAKQAEAPRKMLVDVYTDWCGWCKEMDRRTFADPEVAREINAHFYAVKLDAEAPGRLRYRGRTFSLETGARRATHALARELLGGRLGYPTMVFLDERGDVIQAVPGFHEADAFLRMARYFGQDHYRRVAWEEFGRE